MAQDKEGIIQEILVDSLEILCEELKEPKYVLRAMISRRALSEEERDTIRNAGDADDQIEMLLHILKTKPASAYETFMQVLHDKAKDLWQKVKEIEAKYEYTGGAIPEQVTRDEHLETTHQSADAHEEPAIPPSTNPAQSGTHTSTVSSVGKAKPAPKPKPVVKEKPVVKAQPTLKAKPPITPRKLKPKPQIPSVPDAPGKPKVENQDINTIGITWTSPASGSPVTEYVIEKLDVKTSNWVQVADKVTDTTYTTTAVTAGIEYRFRILALDMEAISIPSEVSDVIVPYDVPSQPGTPEVEVIGKTNVRITWSAPENNGGSQLTGYVIEQCLGSDEVSNEKVTGTTYTIRDLVLGNLYIFRISAENHAGLGKPSDPTTIMLPDKPDAPDKPKVDDNQDIKNISISWSPPGDGGSAIIGYTIEIMKGDGWVEIANKVTELSYTTDDLETDTKYQFRVYAENVIGCSNPSQPLEIITPEDETPLEIRLRGADALAAYQEASKEGKKEIRSIRLMLVGQERVGKTSLVKAFMRDRQEQL
ncbi:immunoglobulin-like and fibronectin type III domain-containing protein 1 [Amphiura filiformis]|uniref:immunoglobulin-like and fibronectin type III domain-containing protein 1 n=1 Tax=Amphiura filiformis TaxID=82378 RepID=UPI003B21C058